MNKEEFDRLARDFEQDVYGDIFAESGYGISFCFSLATAIYVYAIENMGHYESISIRQALEQKPVSFCISPIFNFTNFLALTDQEYGDDTDAKMVYDAIVFQPETLKTYLDALIWYCTEADKKEGK